MKITITIEGADQDAQCTPRIAFTKSDDLHAEAHVAPHVERAAPFFQNAHGAPDAAPQGAQGDAEELRKLRKRVEQMESQHEALIGRTTEIAAERDAVRSERDLLLVEREQLQSELSVMRAVSGDSDAPKTAVPPSYE